MTGCQIGDDVVDVGDFIDFTDLGVRLTCKSGGVVEPSATPVISYKDSSINDVTYLNIDLFPSLCQDEEMLPWKQQFKSVTSLMGSQNKM